jgi:hypothetical protein
MKQAELNRLRAALKAIRYEVQQATEGDRNPNRGDLYRLDRIAAEALKGDD